MVDCCGRLVVLLWKVIVIIGVVVGLFRCGLLVISVSWVLC